jgi:hypothetical protein
MKLTFKTKGWEFKTPHSFAIKWMDLALGKNTLKFVDSSVSTKSTSGFLELGFSLGFFIARLTGIGLVGSFAPLRFCWVGYLIYPWTQVILVSTMPFVGLILSLFPLFCTSNFIVNPMLGS